MVGLKRTRLHIAKYLREVEGIECGTTVKVGDIFTLRDGTVVELTFADTSNCWGISNGMMRLEVAA